MILRTAVYDPMSVVIDEGTDLIDRCSRDDRRGIRKGSRIVLSRSRMCKGASLDFLKESLDEDVRREVLYSYYIEFVDHRTQSPRLALAVYANHEVRPFLLKKEQDEAGL